ncbi:MAG: hypothetical protein N2114_02355, partial [Candidatus Goldbacteria bacterium]|nr:hypothetical protein [Candidatus Goldiibacteriota bacterium]
MENIFNLLSTGILIIILFYIFILFYNKQNYKYFLPIYSVIVISLCVDFALGQSNKNGINIFLLLVFFIFTVFIFLKHRYQENNRNNYEKEIHILAVVFFIYYLLLIFKTAWISDDAYITFRVADNFINGYGLRWNTEERVQVFTNTLFLFTFIPIYFIFRDAYFAGLLLNFIFSISTILLLKKLTDSKEKFLLILAGLCFSKAYIDFSTSGLENSLTFFLIVLFLYVSIKITDLNKKWFYLSLIFSGLFLNRPDAILIVIPAILFMLYIEKPPYKFIFYGLIPLFLWEVFSFIYYGFPLPNTFYAKLLTGIDKLS